MATTEMEHVSRVWATMKPNSPIYSMLLNDISLTSCAHGHVVARMQLSSIHVNSKGTLHGVVSACLVDWMGSMVVASHGLEKTGVAVDLHTTYVSTAKEGDWVEVEGKSNKV